MSATRITLAGPPAPKKSNEVPAANRYFLIRFGALTTPVPRRTSTEPMVPFARTASSRASPSTSLTASAVAAPARRVSLGSKG